MVAQGVPAGRAEADLEVGQGLPVHAPALGVREGRGGAVQQQAVEVDRRALVGLAQGTQLVATLALALDFDACAVGEDAQRAVEVGVLLTLDEGEHVAARAAGAEAVPRLAVRTHRERRRLLVVEGAHRLELAPGLLQIHIGADDVDDVQPGLDVVDDGHERALSTRGWAPTKALKASMWAQCSS